MNKKAILDRAFDKAVKGVKLAELEEKVLRECCAYSAKLAHKAKEPLRKQIWAHFGWDTPESEAKFRAMLDKIKGVKNES